MSLLNCYYLIRSLGKTQVGGVNLSTLIPQQIANEAKQLSAGYDIKNDTYFYNQTTFNLFKINTALVGGTTTLVGAAT